ncbi:MAG: hypothetical protein AABX73_00310 [Nanoarchaeota archaeon]
MKKIRGKILSVIFSVIIIFMLLTLGPTEAFVLGLSISDNMPVTGEIVDLTASLELESGENIPIDFFKFSLIGPENVECEFLLNGTKLSECKGIAIKPLFDDFDFGYGYGYGYGYNPEGKVVSYNIKIDSAKYKPGVYHTKLILISGEEEFEQSGEDIFILQKIQPLLCSVRGDGGELLFKDRTYTKNKVNFHIPTINASNGEGFLIAQSGGRRFSYSYHVAGILKLNKNITLIKTSGTYRDGPRITEKASSIIFLNKAKKIIDISSKNFTLSNADITLIRGC